MLFRKCLFNLAVAPKTSAGYFSQSKQKSIMNNTNDYTIGNAIDLVKLANDLDKMLSMYQSEIVRLRNESERLKLDLKEAIKYQKKYVILSTRTGIEVCPICDAGFVEGGNSEEMPCGLSVQLHSTCTACGGSGVYKKQAKQ